MTHFPAAAIFLIGSTLSAWLRFDKGALLVGWIVMLLRRAFALVIHDAAQERGIPSDWKTSGACSR